MFSWARALFAPDSAEDGSSLFVWLLDSMARSDSSSACASAVWLWAFGDWASRSLQREFELVIMVEVRIEEMFGSD